MLTSLLRRLRRLAPSASAASSAAPEAACAIGCPAPCTEHGTVPCPLLALPRGVRARVVSVGCPVADASRLRVLGVFEGAQVSVVDRRGGILLDVRGSRLALDAAVAATIIALPLAH